MGNEIDLTSDQKLDLLRQNKSIEFQIIQLEGLKIHALEQAMTDYTVSCETITANYNKTISDLKTQIEGNTTKAGI